MALGQVQQLAKGRLGLAAGAGVDAVCPAVVDVVTARAGKLPCADQHLEVGACPVAERFLRGLHFFVVACGADEDVAPAQEGGAQGGLVDAATASALDHHSGEARVHWQAEHRLANLGQSAAAVGQTLGQGAE